MKVKIKWLNPAFVGLLILAANCLRGAIYSKELFWQRPVGITLSEILFSVFVSYFFMIITKKQLSYIQKLEEQGKRANKVLRYVIWLFILIAFMVLGIFLLHEYAHYEHDIQGYINAITISIVCGTILYVVHWNMQAEERAKRQKKQMEEMKREHLETELQLLKSQYHPHFLFNALNTIYFQISEAGKEPRHTIEKLSDLLRYQLYTMDEKVDVSQEIMYVTSYIELMKLRKNEDLKLTTYFDELLETFKIYPLLFQPLVENAFKYVGGEENYIRIMMNKKGEGMEFLVQNSIPSKEENSHRKVSGLGIENLRKRLDLLYPQNYTLTIQEKRKEFVAQLTLLSIV